MILATDTASNETLATQTPVGDVPVMSGQLVTSFVATIVPSAGVRLTWDFMCGENFICGGMSFEIRNGAVFASGTFLTRTTASSVILPLLAAGTYTLGIEAYNQNLVYSPSATFVTFTVHAPSAPTVSGALVGNYVNLTWSAPASDFNIDHYNVYRNTLQIATVRFPFFSYFEQVGGTYSYTVAAVDIAGNLGASSTPVSLSPPVITNFSSYITRVDDFSGTRVNCYRLVTPGISTQTWQDHFVLHAWMTPQNQIDAGFPFFYDVSLDPSSGFLLFLGTNNTQTWQTHFTSHGWNTPQDQINAGFPIFIEPMNSALSGSYQQVFDMVKTYSNVAIKSTWSQFNPFYGVDSLQVILETSTDNVHWVNKTIGQSIPSVSSARYVRITINFTLKDIYSVWAIYNLTMGVDVISLQFDSGTITANSGDVGGTPVTFNKVFKNVTGLALQPAVARICFAADDFTFQPNTNSMNVFLYDQNGNRLTGTVNWSAQGNG